MTVVESLLDGLAEARRHWGQTALSLLGLVLGTASIVTVLALFGGQAANTQRYLDEVGGVGTLVVENREERVSPTARERASRRLTYRDARRLDARATAVARLSPGWSERLAYRAAGTSFDGEVVGTVPDYAAINDLTLLAGRFLGELDVERRERVVVLGWAYADSLFDRAEAAVGRVVRLGGRPYTVVGVLAREEFYFAAWSGNALEYRNRRAYVPITTAIAQHGADSDRLAFLTVQARPGAVAAAETQVRSLLYQMHGVEDFDVRAAGRRDEDDGQFLLLFNFIFLVVGVVSMITGGIVIANILLASVVERVREFGTRMALGATGHGIFLQVLAQVLVITVAGGLAGLALGWGLTGVVAHFMQLPAVVSPEIATLALATALGVGLLAGIYPAVRAARLSPVEALRYG